MADRELLVRIVGDDRDLQRALANTDRRLTSLDNRTQSFGRNIGRAFGAAGIAIGTQQLFQGLAFSVSAASDLNEQISRTEVVLGSSSKEMIEWSRTTADAMGISQRAALAATGTFAGLFQTVGVARPQAAELSRALVQLAADLASLQNSSPEEALVALRSGLAGESEPLRRFNIFLTEARVSQQALTESGKTSVKQLTQQEKTLARYSLILKDSTLAQGNFAATSNELANQQRILAAQVDDLAAKFGSVLVPSITAVVGSLNDAFEAAEDVAGVLRALAALPGIEIPVKIVSNVAEGRGGDILRHIVLGEISPLALGITIGKEISDGIRQGMDAEAFVGGPDSVQPGVGGAQRAASRAQRAEQERQAKATQEAIRDGNATIARITRQAGAQKSLNQQIAESERRAAHLQDLIREDPDNLKLQKRLAAEIRLQTSLRAQQVSLTRQNAVSARSAAVAAKAEAAAIADARREREKAAAEARRSAVRGSQFEALGLTDEGDKRVPGVGALRRRLSSIRESVEGTVLDTKKTNRQLDGISKVLAGKFGKVGKEVREAILQMFNDIAGAMDQGDKKVGPLTKTTSLNSKKLLAGVGLSPEEIRELRGRLSSFNSAGIGNAGANNRPSGGGFTGGTGFVIENNVTVSIDGQKFTAVVTKQQQKQKRRNPKQKRGPNRNR